MKPRKVQSVGLNLLVAVISLLAFIPIYVVIVNSLKDQTQASSMGVDLPQVLHLENFGAVVEKGKLGIAFFNSMLYAGVSTVIAVMVSAMAAFVLARNQTRTNRYLYYFFIMGITLPTNYVALTKIMQITHLINTKPGIILLYAASQIPFGVFLIYGFMQSLPRELDEAAIIDGCGPLRLFFSIILPMLTPVLITMGVLSFLGAWNEFLAPLYFLNRSTDWPMTLAVYNFFGTATASQPNWNLVSADILLTITPVVVVYLVSQRFILSGLTAGSVKG